jgi:hypothetical protein
MRPENIGRGMEDKADREVSTATAPAAVQGAVPATPPAGGAKIKTYEEAWKKGLAAERVVEIWNGRVEEDTLRAVEAEEPSIEWQVRDIDAEGHYRASLRLVLPPPIEPPFDKNLLRAKGVAAAFVSAFLSDEARGGIRFADGTEYVFDVGDGVAVLESFVKLCMALYGAYTTRGIKAEVDDIGGDFTNITVRATWRG